MEYLLFFILNQAHPAQICDAHDIFSMWHFHPITDPDRVQEINLEIYISIALDRNETDSTKRGDDDSRNCGVLPDIT
jgi:hypothetical protein